MVTFTHGVEETEALGALVANALQRENRIPSFLALYGDLGVGKTAFVRGFSSVFAKGKTVKSPTYTVVNQYRGEAVTLFHFDMYRIDGEEALYSIGFDDYLNNKKAICLCEWSEKIPFAVPADAIKITINKTEKEEERQITVEGVEV